MNVLYDYNVKKPDGTRMELSELKGKVVLIVNTASKCGFTPQYTALEQLYKRYKGKGLVILGFPCNQFMHQEPGTDQEIQQFCKLTYDVTFPVLARIEVNGKGRDPLWKWLSDKTRRFPGNGAIKWNFTKFLIDRKGGIAKRYEPATTPEAMEEDLVKLLEANG